MAETADQRIARIVDDVLSGKRTTDDIRRSVDLLAGRPAGTYSTDDSYWLRDPALLKQRVQQIFTNRGVDPNTTTPATPGSDLDPWQQNAYDAMTGMLRQWGLESLAPKLLEFIQAGYDQPETLTLKLQDTVEYKQRFSANEERRKQGLQVLNPAEYIQLERQYEQVMRAYGMPPGFYDQQSDFSKFIGLDVSPAEVQQRVESAARLVNDSNPQVREELARFYPELTQGDLIAQVLDPKAALPVIDKKIRAAEVAAGGRMAGLSVRQERAERFADRGVSYEQAQQGYGDISGFLDDTKVIADRFGESYSQRTAENEVLGGLASARRKRDEIYGKERGLFQGGSGVDRSSLNRPSAGSY